jgi:hypothetical protein
MVVVEVVRGQGALLEVVGALNTVGRRAHLLHGRQQQADEHGDDGDHHQQLDQREAAPRLGIEGPRHGHTSFRWRVGSVDLLRGLTPAARLVLP